MRSDIGQQMYSVDQSAPVEKTNIHSLFTQKLNMAEIAAEAEALGYCSDGDAESGAGKSETKSESHAQPKDIEKSVLQVRELCSCISTELQTNSQEHPQIKREDGLKTYVLKLPYWATIQDVRSALDKHRVGVEGTLHYELRSTFPPRTYDDLQQTLEDAGLVPNATLFLREV